MNTFMVHQSVQLNTDKIVVFKTLLRFETYTHTFTTTDVYLKQKKFAIWDNCWIYLT